MKTSLILIWSVSNSILMGTKQTWSWSLWNSFWDFDKDSIPSIISVATWPTVVSESGASDELMEWFGSVFLFSSVSEFADFAAY